MPEVIPELVYVIGLLFAVVGYVTARGLLATWTHSLGYVFEWLAAKLPNIDTHIPGIGHLNLKAPFQAIDGWVVSALQAWCDGAEIEMGYCLHGMTKVALYTARMVDWLAAETEQSLNSLVHIHLPKWAKYALAPALLPLLLPKLLKALASHVVHTVTRTVHVVTHEVVKVIPRTVVRTATVAIPGVRDLPWIRREVHGLTKRNLRISKRLHRLEALLGVTAMAAAMANVLGLPNWRCLTRGNVGKVARRLCTLQPRFLDDLLGLISDFLILENICTVLPWIETAASEIGTPLVEGLTEVGAGLCRGSKAPGALQGPAPSIPALIFGVTPSGV